MRRFFSFCLLLELLWLNLPDRCLQAQSIPKAETDSLLRLLQVSKADSSRVKLYLQLGKYYVFKLGESPADMDSAFAYAKKAEALSRRLSFADGYDQSQLLLARTLSESKRMDQLRALLQKMKPEKNKADILLLVGEHYLYRPLELPADLDSAEYYTKQAFDLKVQLKDETGQVESLFTLAKIFLERNEPTKASVFQQKAIALLEKVKDLERQAHLCYQLGDSYNRSPELMPEKINSYQKALALYRQLGNQEQEANTLKTIADMHQHQGQYAQSLRELLEVVRIQKSIGFRKIHYTYDLLGHVYARMGNYELALPYALEAIKSVQATADTVDLIVFYNRVGKIHLVLNQHQQALEVYQMLLSKLLREPNNTYFQFRLGYFRYMSQALLALKRPGEGLAFLRKTLAQYPPENSYDEKLAALSLGEAYLGTKDYASAEKHLLEGLAQVTSAINKVDVNWEGYVRLFHINLVSLYLATKQYQKASFYLAQNFQLVNQHPDPLELSTLHRQAFQLDSAQGNFTSAIAHYQHYKTLQDSIFNERKSNQLIAYQVQYETEKKEQELKLKEQNIALLTQRSKAQQATIRQRQTERNAWIGGAVLLLFLSGVIYNRYRFKQRSNQQLQAHQQLLAAKQAEVEEKNGLLEELVEQKEWLLKEVHHRVKNNLQIIISLLQSQGR